MGIRPQPQPAARTAREFQQLCDYPPTLPSSDLLGVLCSGVPARPRGRSPQPGCRQRPSAAWRRWEACAAPAWAGGADALPQPQASGVKSTWSSLISLRVENGQVV